MTTQCVELVHRRRSIGVMGKGAESFRTTLGRCSRRALEGSDLCRTHQRTNGKISRILAARKGASS